MAAFTLADWERKAADWKEERAEARSKPAVKYWVGNEPVQNNGLPGRNPNRLRRAQTGKQRRLAAADPGLLEQMVAIRKFPDSAADAYGDEGGDNSDSGSGESPGRPGGSEPFFFLTPRANPHATVSRAICERVRGCGRRRSCERFACSCMCASERVVRRVRVREAASGLCAGARRIGRRKQRLICSQSMGVG